MTRPAFRPSLTGSPRPNASTTGQAFDLTRRQYVRFAFCQIDPSDLAAVHHRCSHARGPLSDGELGCATCTVTCPWHDAKLDLRTGQVVDGIASVPVQPCRGVIRDGVIHVGYEPEEA